MRCVIGADCALVDPPKATRICLVCGRLLADGALDWGLVDDLAAPGQTVALVRMVKEGINATANALHKVSSFAGAGQSQLSGAFAETLTARDAFTRKS